MSCVLAVDLGGTKAMAAVVDGEGAILGRGRAKIPARGDWPRILGVIKDAMDQALESAGVSMDAVDGCGIGVPGPVDRGTGVARQLPNLDVFDVPVREDLTRHTGKPTVVENDVDGGLLGEAWRGAAQGKRHVVGMFPGTGLGGAVMVDGRIHRGKTGITGEIGHMVMDPKGPQCGCGRRGCLEAYASRTAMEAWVRDEVKAGATTVLAQTAQPSLRIGARTFRKAVAAGDQVAVTCVNRAATYLGFACANLILLLSPEMIVLGGGVMEALAPSMMDRIRKVAAKRCLPGCYDEIEIVEAQCKDDAVVLGAARSALDSMR